jgi:hypothetical protein
MKAIPFAPQRNSGKAVNAVRRAVSTMVSGIKNSPRLHPLIEDTNLVSHLSSHYSGSDFRTEAFAEVTKDYLTLYKACKADDAQINQAMSDKYPNLWPVYRDQALVEMAARIHSAHSGVATGEEAVSHTPSGNTQIRIGGRDPRDIRADAGAKDGEIRRS